MSEETAVYLEADVMSERIPDPVADGPGAISRIPAGLKVIAVKDWWLVILRHAPLDVPRKIYVEAETRAEAIAEAIRGYPQHKQYFDQNLADITAEYVE